MGTGACTFVRDFVSDTSWIASKLGITADQARRALKDLSGAGLLKSIAGKWTKAVTNTRVAPIPSRVLRSYHLQLLEKGRRAIESHSVETRKYLGMTMAIDPSRLPEAEARMAKFSRELMAFLEQGERTQTYHFSALLFRLDRDFSAKGLLEILFVAARRARFGA